MNRFTENFKQVDFGAENDPLTPFWVQYKFSKNQDSCYHPLFDACHQVHFQKNLEKKLEKHSKVKIFNPKMTQ